ncbi:MAG TPA: hypothetical protein VIY73_23130, partial [Polyangiaceae bacterium]
MLANATRILGALAATLVAAVVLVMPGCGGGGSATGGGPDATDQGDDVEEAATIIGADSAPLKGCSGYPGKDPSTLPGAGCCSSGPSHCVPTNSLPSSIDSAFVSCADSGNAGLCVPDSIISKGSEYVPAT